MWFECEQPFLSGERCVTSRKTAAKETRCLGTSMEFFLVCIGSCQEMVQVFVCGEDQAFFKGDCNLTKA